MNPTGKAAFSLRVIKTASPWIWFPIILWSFQLWSIWSSQFSLEMTILQFPFVLAFEVLIYVIVAERVKEKEEFEALLRNVHYEDS